MRLLNAQQIKTVDANTLKQQKLTSEQLMKRAADAFTTELVPFLDRSQVVQIFCGSGNNGGDGLVVAKNLLNMGYRVDVRLIKTGNESKEFSYYLRELTKNHSSVLQDYSEMADREIADVVIDAVFGAGLNRPIGPELSKIIDQINRCAKKIVAVDVPSGVPVFPDFVPNVAIKATTTLTFQSPKLSFLMPEYHQFVGEWRVVDIGLDFGCLAKDSGYTFLTPEELPRREKRSPFAHKNLFGHALIIAGSKGMTGAAHLAAKSALRSGVGLVSVHTSGFGEKVLQESLPEAICISDTNHEHVSSLPELGAFTSIGVGPGLGKHAEIRDLVVQLLKKRDVNIVLDADALNAMDDLNQFVLEHKIGLDNVVLTPHIGEFDRLFGKSKTTWARIEKAKEFCIKNRSTIVLKGRYTAIVHPSGNIYFNSTGCPAMSKAGSGDVLTGILTALLAREGNIETQIHRGVILHGKAGELAEELLHEECVLASDIIEQLPSAFTWLDSQVT